MRLPSHLHNVEELRQLDTFHTSLILSIDVVHIWKFLLDPLQNIPPDQFDRFHLVFGKICFWLMSNDVVVEFNHGGDDIIVFIAHYQF